MTDREFSLLEEPWILVIGTENQTRKVSLTQALLQAHQIRDLAGESTTQDSAVLGVLLAVVYTVFSKTDEQGIEAPITGIQEEYGAGALSGIVVPFRRARLKHI